MNDADGDGVNDRVAELMTQLATAMNDMDGDGVNDRVAELMTQLATAMNDADGDGVNDDVARLMGELTTAMNDADGDGVNDRVAELMTQLATAMNDADGDGVNDRVAELMTQLATAMNDMDGDGVNDRVAELMTQLATAMNDADGDGVNDEVARLMGELRAAVAALGDSSTGDLAADIAALKKIVDDAAEDVEDAAAKKASTLANGFLIAMVTPNTDSINFTAKSTADGADVTVNPDADNDNESDYSDSDKPLAPAINGFHPFVQETKADRATNTFNVIAGYTDIDADGPKSLLADEVAGENAFFFLVSDTDSADADFAKNARTAGFPSAPATGSTAVLLGSLVTPAGATAERLEFSGMWRGVPGTFICTVGDCDNEDSRITVTAMLDDGEEELTATIPAGVTWVFQPDDAKATVDVPDEDYLHFGWWHQVPTTDTGAGDHEFRTFSGGSQPFTAANLQAVEGEATYSGAATGKFAQQGGTLLKPTYVADLFTATATLTADFGDADGAGTIEGDITDFQSPGETDVSGWEVTLNSIALTDNDATFESTDGTADNNAVAEIDGVDSTSGTWSGEFFGNNGPDDQPGSVAGVFRADFGETGSVHTSIAGAYGASNTGGE